MVQVVFSMFSGTGRQVPMRLVFHRVPVFLLRVEDQGGSLRFVPSLIYS
jgi:hypothetical protein